MAQGALKALQQSSGLRRVGRALQQTQGGILSLRAEPGELLPVPPAGQGSRNSSGQVGRCLVEEWKPNTSVAVSLAFVPGSAVDGGKSLQNVVNDEWKGKR